MNKVRFQMKILFWYRKNQTNPSDEGTVQIRITINAQRAEIGSIGIRCLPAQWDATRQCIKGRSLTVQRKNERLELVLSKIDGLYNDLLRQNRPVTAGYFKQVWMSGTVTYTILGMNQSSPLAIDRLLPVRVRSSKSVRSIKPVAAS